MNRVLSFTYRNFDGAIPEPGPLSQADEALLETTRQAMDRVGDSLGHTRFKVGLTQAFSLAQETNRYLDSQAPWQAIKSDRAAAATTLNVAIRVLNCLKVVLAPYLPFSSQRLHEYLGFDGAIESEKWDFRYLTDAIKPGATMRQPHPLYTKLDPGLVEEETARLGIEVA